MTSFTEFLLWSKVWRCGKRISRANPPFWIFRRSHQDKTLHFQRKLENNFLIPSFSLRRVGWISKTGFFTVFVSTNFPNLNLTQKSKWSVDIGYWITYTKAWQKKSPQSILLFDAIISQTIAKQNPLEFLWYLFIDFKIRVKVI